MDEGKRAFILGIERFQGGRAWEGGMPDTNQENVRIVDIARKLGRGWSLQNNVGVNSVVRLIVCTSITKCVSRGEGGD